MGDCDLSLLFKGKKKKEKQQGGEPPLPLPAACNTVREAPTCHLEGKGCITSLGKQAVTSFVPVASSPHGMVNSAPRSCATNLAVTHSPDSAFCH